MPSKIEYELTKLRGEVSETGEVYTESIANLQNKLTEAENEIKELKADNDSILSKISNAFKKASHALSNASSSLKKTGDKMAGVLDMDDYSIKGVTKIETHNQPVFHIWDDELSRSTLAIDQSNGNITVIGSLDGRDVAGDGTKLDTVATNADVTADNPAGKIPTSAPGSPVNGDQYFNLTSNRHFVYNAGWQFSAVYTGE